MTNKELEAFLNSLHHKLAESLLDRLENGVKVVTKQGDVETADISPADLNVIRQFLKDNNVNGIVTDDNPLGKLAKHALPKTFGEDDHSTTH